MTKQGVARVTNGAIQPVSPLPRAGFRKLLRFRHVILALVMAACGGTLGKRTAGGESHFLEVCRESCGAGLECVSGVCTRSCLVDKSDCTDLSPNAQCTNRSLEPGQVAICDVSCDRDRDCSALGDDFRCPAGFCRVGSSSEQPPQNQPDSAGAGGGPSFLPFDPQCQRAPEVQSDCSFEATCAELGCGEEFSQFDANGCTRYCKADADCGAGMRCRHTVLAITENECPSLGSEVEGCELFEGKCSCSITEDCVRPSLCVDAAAFPESVDCAVETATCAQLDWLQVTAKDIAEHNEASELRDQAAQCLERVDAQRVELGCGPNVQLPFLPECDESPGFNSNCGFELTCEQLGCGDGFSQFDENGCARYCDTSADCGQGQRCRHTRLALSEQACPSPGSEVEGCSLENGACECGITDDCVHPDICVDETKYPESLDCAVEGASCQALANGRLLLQDFVDAVGPTDPAASEAQSCLDAIQAKQAVSCTQ